MATCRTLAVALTSRSSRASSCSVLDQVAENGDVLRRLVSSPGQVTMGLTSMLSGQSLIGTTAGAKRG